MNKKLLLSSIITVVILILVSFTSVIGYRNIESDVKISPLFNIRSSKAIGEESKDITCDYVGKGEKTNLHLSSRIGKTEEVQKTIEVVSEMSDRTLIKYFGRIINQKQMTDKEKSDLLIALHYIRGNPDDMNYYFTENSPKVETFQYLTCRWWPGCYLYLVLVLIMGQIIGTITYMLSCYIVPTTGCCNPP